MTDAASRTPLAQHDIAADRERVRRRRVVRLCLVVLGVEAYVIWAALTGRPLVVLPQVDPLILAPVLFFVVLIALLLGTQVGAGRSPHVTFRPEQVDVTLDDVVGIDPIVDDVRRSIDLFQTHRRFADQMGGTPRRGILFEGPPGTGKTLTAKAMAAEAGVPFLFVSATSFQSMYYGATARKIRTYFKALRTAARKEGGAIGFIEGNAVEHGGSVETLRIEVDEETVRFCVEDRGPGFAAGDLVRCFESFRRGQGRAGSLGLGLSLVRRIALVHGGEAWAPRAVIEDDLRKRQALLDSEQFWVWTVTWADVVGGEGGGKTSVPTLFSHVHAKQRAAAAEAMQGPTVDGVEHRSCLEQLLTFLESPDAQAWSRTALALGFGLLALAKPLAVGSIQAIRTHLEEAPALGTLPTPDIATIKPALLGAHRCCAWAHLLGTIDAISAGRRRFGNLQILLRLFDEAAARRDPEFEPAWRAFFHAWNVLQFHRGGTEVVSSEWLAQERGEAIPADAPSPTQQRRKTRETPAITELASEPTMPVSFLGLLGDFPEAEPLLRRLFALGLPPPAEFEGLGGPAIEVEAILGWPQARIAVCLEIGDDDRRVWTKRGWCPYRVGDVNDIVDAVAAAVSRKGEP